MNVDASLELRGGPGGILPLTSDKLTIGKATSNDLAIETDPTVSRFHAVVERFAPGWCIKDVGSRNGTYVNGERIVGERVLRAGDEIRLGSTLLLFRDTEPASETATAAKEPAPDLTRKEKEILVLLCRPVLSADMLTEPATVRDMADELVVTESAVKKHLIRLYDKFDLYETSDRRRGKLANEAIRRGAVTLGDLRVDGQP